MSLHVGVRGPGHLARVYSAGAAAFTYEGLIASRCGLMQVSQTAQDQMMAISPHYATDDISDLRVFYTNFIVNGGKEVGNAGTATVEACVEHPAGVFTFFKFGGADVGNIPAVPLAGATTEVGAISSDLLTLGFTIPAGTAFKIRTLFTNTSGIFYLATGYRDAAAGAIVQYQAATTWTRTTLQGVITSSAGNFAFAPMGLTGTTSKGTILLIGDSIQAGSSQQFSMTPPDRRTGLWATSMLADAAPAFVNLAVGGAQTGDFMSFAPGRSILFPYASNVGNNLGTNTETSTANTAAQKLANNTALITATQATTGLGFRSTAKWWLSLVTPRATDTTTGFATTGGQTATTSATVLSYNALLNPVPAGFSGVFDFNTGLLAADATLIWSPAAGARLVTDGAITSGTTTLTSATANFTSADLYTVARVAGAGAAGAQLLQTITAILGPTQVTLSGSAGTTVTGASTYIGGITRDGLHGEGSAYNLAGASGVIDPALFTAQ